MSDYGDDEYDALLDTDPIALRDRCRAAEAKVARVREVLDDYDGVADVMSSGIDGALRDAIR